MKKRLPEDLKIKMLSILIAFGMWMYVMEVKNPMMTRNMDNVPIAGITNMTEITEKGLTLSYGQDLSIDIDIRGSRSYVTTYLSSGIKVEGYVDNPKVGDNVMTLSIPSVSGIEYSFNPRVFYVKLEESIIEEKSLNISTSGEPKEDFFVESIELSKEAVYIEGSKTQVDKVEQVIGSVNVENVGRSFSQRVQLTAVDKSGTEVEGVVINGGFVVADITMQKSKEVPVQLNIINSKGEPVESKALKPNIEKVTISGSADLVDAVEKIDTQAISVSDINQYPDKRYDLVSINYIKFSDNRISLVTIAEEEGEYEFSIPRDKIELLGDNKSDEIMNTLPENVLVKFRASKEYIEILGEDAMKLYIDNTVAASTYKLKYAIEYPIVDITLEPSHITITE